MSIRPTQNKVITSDSLEYLKLFNDYQADILFCDPPYALGSEVIIRQDGKVDYKKASDFMNKWGMPTGDYWEKWFIEAYRILKHGGYLIMYGMDRQLLLFKYYASLAGFQEQQSIYWYYISNFPKATDLSKMIDKNAGAERNIIEVKGNKNNEVLAITKGVMADNNAITDLAKKYNGYKYSISPLKQTNETILIFRKPYKSGSCLHDTLAFENGDNECRCGALNIDGNRVPNETPISIHNAPKGTFAGGEQNRGSNTESYREQDGRYPSQTFCDSNTAEVLDKQSGILKSGDRKPDEVNNDECLFGFGGKANGFSKGSIGGCSKILHKCNYEQDDYDLYFYNPKVSGQERNKGLQGIENNHPTLKPIELNKKILKLFKTPNEQVIIYPFAGSGSEIIGGHKANFRNWFACEVNGNYTKIANARIKYFEENDYEQLSLFDE